MGVGVLSAAVFFVTRFLGNIDFAAKNWVDIDFSAGFVELNRPKKVAVVGNRQRIVTIVDRSLDQVGNTIRAV